jgi:hypothetical protein
MSEPIVTPVNYVIPTQQEYNTDDLLLIQSTEVSTNFNPQTDYVEVFVYGLGGDLIDTDYNYVNYSTNPDSSNVSAQQYVLNNIKINPVVDLESYLLDTGTYIINYNFYKSFFSSSIDTPFYIKEISSNRTELRLATNYLNPTQLSEASAEFSASRFDRLLDDFYLNFGDNNILIANNFLLDNTTTDYTLLVKLYEPLPEKYSVKSQTWIVDKISNDTSYQVEFIFEPTTLVNQFQLKGPNTNLNLKDQINNSTTYQDYSSIISSSLTSSQQQYFSLLEEKAIDINIDFSDYSNFIHFSSAKLRLDNFYYKVEQIENYNNELYILNPLTTNTPVSSSKAIIQSNINGIIENFDEYEYYLYYNSSSYAWPKSTSTKPYILYPTGSTQVLNWFGSTDPVSPYYGGQIYSASIYDEGNQNNLYYSIPEYVRTNPDNEQYELFIAMIGQLFDNVWVYYKDITNKYNADNRLDFGVSKDLIAEVIRDLGIRIYQNNFSSQDVFSSFLGINPDGGLLPMTGSELITNYVTSSNEMIPLDNIEKSIYKRIYHNLPYLLKTKGTVTGLQTLISLYGVDDTILRVAEFGGKDKNNVNDWDYWKDRFNYAYITNNDGFISTEWSLNSNWNTQKPQTLQFRFKTPGIGSGITNPSQSLWSLDDAQKVSLVLEYNNLGYTSGSYSGSVVDPYNEYATLKFFPDGNTASDPSASIYLPLFNGGWWSVMLTVDQISSDPATYTLYAANNIYNGDDGATIGFEGSSSITASITQSNSWGTSTNSYFPTDNRNNIGNYQPFSGSYQEIRYYNVGLSQSVFDDFVMNPDSIEGNSLNSSPNELAFRASLGGELYTGSVSIHPKVTGSWDITSSFSGDSNITITEGEYLTNTETVYLDQPAAGIKNIVSNKIQVVGNILPTGDTLSAFRSIQQNVPASSSYTPNISYTEIAFSPQNEINDDIMGSIGFFNMGDYIGDPRQQFTQNESYPSLDTLRNEYFTKYTGNYDINDYIRLIKYFDNSLFKMIQDFTPARTSLASGIVIKQHLLERNKYPVPQLTPSASIAFVGSGSTNIPYIVEDQTLTGSIETAFITGSTGGTFNQFNGLTNEWQVTQSWSGILTSPLGDVAFTQSSQEEFYNGELSGSEYEVTNGELNEGNVFKNPNTAVITYDFYQYTLNADDFSTRTQQNAFLALTPGSGEIFVYNFYDGDNSSGLLPRPTYGNKWILVSKEDTNNTVVTNTLQDLQTLTIIGAKVMGSQEFNILSISERATYFIYLVAPNNISFSLATGVSGQQGESTGSRQTVLSPYDSFTFVNSDDNPLFNNALLAKESTHFFGVDYSNGALIPTNQQSIISGSATPSDVQQYNWFLKRSTIPRYEGSKLSAQNYNTWSLGDQSYGKDPVINYNGNVAFDVSFVGGTYPEMMLGTAINIIRANIFTSVSQSVIIDQNSPEIFNFMVDQYLGFSQSSQVFSNDLSPIKDNNIQTIKGDIGWPDSSVYFVPRQQTFGAGSPYNFSGSWVDSTRGGLVFYGIGYTPASPFVMKKQVVDENDQYATGSNFDTVHSASILISQSLENGDKWFVTLYSGSNYPLQTFMEATETSPLFPFNSGSNYNHSKEASIASQGVYEIASISLFPSGSGGFGNGMLGVLQLVFGNLKQVQDTKSQKLDH